jgi:hypothetical protein
MSAQGPPQPSGAGAGVGLGSGFRVGLGGLGAAGASATTANFMGTALLGAVKSVQPANKQDVTK